MTAATINQQMKKKILPGVAALCLVTFSAGPLLAGDPSVPVAAPTAGKAVLVIKDSKDAQTFNAEDQDVTVNGSNNKVTIKGTCHALTVSGDMNGVTVEAVATISVDGSGNQVAYGKTVDGTNPQITDTGKGNQITHSAAKSE